MTVSFGLQLGIGVTINDKEIARAGLKYGNGRDNRCWLCASAAFGIMTYALCGTGSGYGCRGTRFTVVTGQQIRLLVGFIVKVVGKHLVNMADDNALARDRR